MKKSLLIVLILPVFFSLSCEKISSEDIEIQLQSEKLNLVDAGGRSCKVQTSSTGPIEDDLSPVKILINRFGIKWTGKNPLRIAYIRLTLSGGGISEFKYVISGTELGAMWNAGTTNGNVVELSPSGTVQQTSTRCNIEVGGIDLANKNVTSYGQGKLTVYGTTPDGSTTDGVSASAYFTWEFRGID